MKKIFFVVCCMAALHGLFAQTFINKAEYFIDVDPGVGAGKPIVANAVNDTANISFSVPTTSIAAGFHNLFLRFQYNTGKWGLYDGRPFYLIPAGSFTTYQLNKAEYFFDTDPGVGNGTAIADTFTTDTANLVFSANTSALSAGFHNLFVRYRNTNGNWGLYDGRPFYIIPANSFTTYKINKAEYFFDTDPGVGHGTAITISTPTDTASLALNIATTGLAQGFHNLFIRYQGNNGEWGLYDGRPFYLMPSVSFSSQQISAAEYFIDNDPGVGNGTPITVTTPVDTSSLVFTVSANSLSADSHHLAVRFKYVNGTWGLFDLRSFYICNNPPSASITAVGNTSICTPNSVLLVADTVNGTGNTYQWQNNGVNINGATSYTYAATLTGNYTCNVCRSICSAVSNTISVTVTTTVTPSITIAASPTGAICAGTDVVFAATPANGGTAPSYQWEVNGSNVGGDSIKYTATALTNAAVVKCILTSNATCATSPTATSGSITETVNPIATPSIGIAANPTGAICTGTNVTFTATPTNGGNAPSYQWQINGGNVGSSSSSYVTNALTNGAVITCVLTSNVACATTTTATSGGITETVNSILVPSVSVNASATTICSGTSVTFTATPTNGGTAPAYQWVKNGTNVSTNSATYTLTTLNNNDSVWVILTSNSSCASPTTGTSSKTKMTVNPVPSSPTAGSNSPVTVGGTIDLTASTVTGASYLWSGPNSYSSAQQDPTIANATTTMSGSYQVVATLNGCNSNAATVAVTVNTTALSIISGSVTNVLCFGNSTGSITLTVSGGTPPYTYSDNGATFQSGNTFSGLSAGNYTVTVKDAASATTSATYTIGEPTALNTSGAIQNTCTGTASGAVNITANGGTTPYHYSWSNGATTADISLLTANNYYVTVTDANACTITGLYVVNSIPVSSSLLLVSICSGSSYIFNGTAYTQAGTYHDTTFSYYTGCDSIATFTLTVNPIPPAPSAGSNTPVTAGGTIDLTASTVTGATYLWSGPNSYSSAQQDPTIANATTAMSGTYQVVATLNGCNSSPATTTVTVNPGLNTSIISGSIYTEIDSGIPTVTVTATGGTTYLTNGSGSYSFSLTTGSSDTITPQKNNDTVVTNGVTTLDYLLILRHILTIQTLSTPYQIIAADVNSSGTVTAADLALIRQMILQERTSFPGNKLWAFVPASYTFSNPQDPFPYPSTLTYSNLTTQTNQNFIGVKLGDVNDSWNPLVDGPKSPNIVNLSIPQLTGAPQTEIWVPVRAQNFNNISGMQCTVAWDATKLEFTGIDSTRGNLSEVDYGAGKVSAGQLAIAWTDPSYGSTTVPDDSVLFYIKYQITGNGGDSSMVAVNSSMTMIEIIDSSMRIDGYTTTAGEVKIGTTTGIPSISGIQEPIISTSPNPFSTSTNLNFELFGNASVTITVYDELGQEIERSEASYNTGNHKKEIGNNWAAGIYYIRFTTGDYVRTLKVIAINK